MKNGSSKGRPTAAPHSHVGWTGSPSTTKDHVLPIFLIVAAGLILLPQPLTAAFPSPHWTQVNQDGFVTGQGATAAGSHLFTFDSRLYAYNEFGVFRMDDPTTQAWTQVLLPAQPGGPGAAPTSVRPFGNFLYAWDSDTLWWAPAGADLAGPSWTRVTSTGLPGNASPPPRIVFAGKLYGVYKAAGSFEIWRTGDLGSATATWERVVQNSFGDPTNNVGVDLMFEFSGRLYAGTDTLGGIFGDPYSYGTGVEIWESPTGNSGSWSQVNVDGFGTMYPTPPCYSDTLCTFPIHQVLGSAAVYQPAGAPQPYLYVGTKSHFGGEVWRYDGTGLSGWTNVTPPWAGPCQIGCGPSRNEAMVVFQGSLYLGEGFPTGNVAIYDGSTWTVEVPGPHPFDPDNGGTASLALFNSGLFAATLHAFGGSQGDQVWRYLDSPADVTGTKTFWSSAGTTLTVGDTLTYTIVLHNASTYDQLDNPGDEFTDVLPAALTLTGASATSGTATTSGNTVHWNGVVPAGGSVTITITAIVGTVAGATVVSNQGSVHSDLDGDGTNETTRLTDDPTQPGASDPTSFLAVYSPADVTGTKTVAPTGRIVTSGETATYTIVLHNASSYDQLDNPGDEFTDALPADLTLTGASATSGTATTAGNTVHWNGVVPAGGSITITITATVNPRNGAGVAVNQGSILVDVDGNGTNETMRVTDDPAQPGDHDPTPITLGGEAIPATSTLGLLMLALAVLGLGAWFLHRGSGLVGG